jgi:hypothetical protein
MALTRPTASGIRKGLAGLGMQLGSRVIKTRLSITEACTHVSKMPDVRAIMGMQDVLEATH